MKLRVALIKLHWLLASQFGLDPRIFLRSLRGLPLFFRDWLVFRKSYSGKMAFAPCLHDRYEEGGAAKSEYFWQDLLVARWIHAALPNRHVDVGSRVDGFVAHVASFREIEVFDVRPISSHVPGILFKQADFMSPGAAKIGVELGGYCDSLSCLHAIEHFGLGRYGDPVDPKGYERGIENLARMLKLGGILYLSTPIGQERVEFNANWVFEPGKIILCAKANGLEVQTLTVVSGDGAPKDVLVNGDALNRLAASRYNLGIFVFKKITQGGSSNA